MDSKAYKLIAWLQRIVPFEVNLKNYLVAANAMISKQVPTGVLTLHHSRILTLPPRELHLYNLKVPPCFGGKNCNPVFSDWREATEICYSSVTE